MRLCILFDLRRGYQSHFRPGLPRGCRKCSHRELKHTPVYTCQSSVPAWKCKRGLPKGDPAPLDFPSGAGQCFLAKAFLPEMLGWAPLPLPFPPPPEHIRKVPHLCLP